VISEGAQKAARFGIWNLEWLRSERCRSVRLNVWNGEKLMGISGPFPYGIETHTHIHTNVFMVDDSVIVPMVIVGVLVSVVVSV